jgi:carboxyl-terminal processing protease
MTSLVLDLRNNPGGFLDQAIHVAEVFLRSGQLILTQKGRDGFRDNTYESRNNAPDMTPLVIPDQRKHCISIRDRRGSDAGS